MIKCDFKHKFAVLLSDQWLLTRNWVCCCLNICNSCFLGHIDHSARVMRVITWNRSFRGLPNADDGLDDFDSEEHETHATVLDKMLAWEKKLYDEVKVCLFLTFLFAILSTLDPRFPLPAPGGFIYELLGVLF